MAWTIAMVEPHPLFRVGLRAGLSQESDLQIVGEAADAGAARALAASRPHILIVEVNLPDGDGISLASDFRRLSPRTRVLALTYRSEEFFVRWALSTGIEGYALKTQPLPEIIEALRSLTHAHGYVAPSLAAVIRYPVSAHQTAGSPFERLSAREREIVALILRGGTNKKMAEALSRSVKTVETHRAHINQKLGVHSTSDLIRLSAQHGFFAPLAEARAEAERLAG